MESYSHRHYPAVEYPGCNPAYVLGHEPDGADNHDGYRHSSHSASYPRSRSAYYPETLELPAHFERTGGAQLAWDTEIPTRLRMTICCEGCRNKLEYALRDLGGVYDVGIGGWSNGLVTVTGTASPQKILKEARNIFSDAELWKDPYEHGSGYTHYRY